MSSSLGNSVSWGGQCEHIWGDYKAEYLWALTEVPAEG